VAEDDVPGVQRRFGLGSAQAGTQPRGQRAAIDLDAAQPRQVEADQSRVRAPQRLDPADHAGSAAERHHRDALGGADLQHPPHGLAVGGQQDSVRSGLEPAPAQPHQVHIAAAGRVAHPVLGRVEDGVGADRLDEGGGQRLGRRQAEVCELGYPRLGLQLAEPLT
jgi:hypothetical protein